MKKYDTVIFDLDGTLLNTIDDLTDSVNYALKFNDFPKRTLDEVRCFVGNGVAKLMERAVPPYCDKLHYEKCLADFKKHYSKNKQNKTDVYAGIMELLKELCEKNYKLAIVSNKFDDAVKALNVYYFENYIKVAIGESEKIAKKPAPDCVFKALDELNSKAENAVYVGDSDVDCKTAKNSGLVCVGVTWGFRDRELLQREGANYIIDEPKELLGVLE